MPETERDWSLCGFLHSPTQPSPLTGFPSAYEVVGEWETFPLSCEDYVLLGVGDPVWKERIWNKLQGRVTFFTYVAPNATIGKFNVIGEGSIICPNCSVTTNVRIGKGVTVNNGTNLGHDVKIEDFTSIMGKVTLTGGVRVGVKAYIGAAATVISQKVIGDGATVGAGSVVIRNVPAGITVFGNPAKPIPR
jgi:sugar O-acyltransferase (sialic acid O-acetyltransferase NeuD family)